MKNRAKFIKAQIINQLKSCVPNWSRLIRKEKKRVAEEVLAEIVNLPEEKIVFQEFTPHELLQIPEIPEDILTRDKMKELIAELRHSLLIFPDRSRCKYISNEELQFLDGLLDDSVIEHLLAPAGYNAGMRELRMWQLFRIELLKVVKYPELSYRKFCTQKLDPLKEKENRSFVGLPLHKGKGVDHSLLSRFRSGMSFSQTVNLMLYFIVLMEEEGLILSPMAFLDSTELASVCSPYPLCGVELAGQKVRIYNNLDVDCGSRRPKRDKSPFVVGYRVNSLIALDPVHGRGIPLVSLVAPANHHDSNFLRPLLVIAHAMGLSVNVVVSDAAYEDPRELEDIRKETGIVVITPPDTKVKMPEWVDEDGNVYCHNYCDTPMRYLGRTESGHEYQCDTSCCPFSSGCPMTREIPMDAGYFNQIPSSIARAYGCYDFRKNGERAFNLLKHVEGVEPLRVKKQQPTQAVVTFAMIVQLIRNYRRMNEKKPKERIKANQLSLFAA